MTSGDPLKRHACTCVRVRVRVRVRVARRERGWQQTCADRHHGAGMPYVFSKQTEAVTPRNSLSSCVSFASEPAWVCTAVLVHSEHRLRLSSQMIPTVCT
eukprot:454073-Rhodomonas_salina.2